MAHFSPFRKNYYPCRLYPEIISPHRPAATAFDFLASGALAKGVVYSILPAFYFSL